MKKIKKLKLSYNLNYLEGIKYLIIGIISVLIDILFYFTLIILFNINNEMSKKISFLSGATWSFVMNKHYTFNSKGNTKKQLILFYILYLITFFLNSLVHDSIWRHFKLDWLALGLATIISVVFNYFGQKFIVFKKRL